jgi:D-methionine transport system ATP-binding protein
LFPPKGLPPRSCIQLVISMIKLTGLNKSFGKHIALQDINLSIHSGEIFGIIGRSGAGKSTLLRCINRLEEPDTGHVYVDNEEITHLKGLQLRKTRHKMAMIFQHFNLLHSKTVYDNIALPMRIQGLSEATIKQKIMELLPLVELSEKLDAYPSELSGGQKQRVAIARALSTSPSILLCDEATSALDPETTDAILELLKKINQTLNLTIVLITHEMDVVKRICNRLALMEHGKIVEETPISDVFNNKDSIARSMLYAQLSPELPQCIQRNLSQEPDDRLPLVRIFFEGHGATVPFISKTSRDLNMDINILLANVDRFENLTCGVLIAALSTNGEHLQRFIQQCEQHNLTVEVLGYVTSDVI